MRPVKPNTFDAEHKRLVKNIQIGKGPCVGYRIIQFRERERQKKNNQPIHVNFIIEFTGHLYHNLPVNNVNMEQTGKKKTRDKSNKQMLNSSR